MSRDEVRRALKPEESSQHSGLSLRYLGPAPVCVRGPVTGWVYRFSPLQPVQPVELRDAQLLLSTPPFRLSQ